MTRSEALALARIAADWDRVGRDLALSGGQVRSGDAPSTRYTLPSAAVAPLELKDGRLVVLAEPGTDHEVARHQGEIVSRLVELGHPVSSVACLPASELERIFARHLIEVSAR